jgi:hypothetical protein
VVFGTVDLCDQPARAATGRTVYRRELMPSTSSNAPADPPLKRFGNDALDLSVWRGPLPQEMAVLLAAETETRQLGAMLARLACSRQRS